MRRLLFLLVALFVAACYDSADTPGSTPEPPAVNTTLAELRRLYAGKTFEVTADVMLDGFVTSHDRAENFYRTFIVERDGAAVEVMAGIDGLHNSYPLGQRVVLRLKGLAVGENHGILQIGRMPAPGSGYPTDYLGSRAALDLHVIRSNESSTPAPLAADLSSLTPEMAGRLVRIDGLRYTSVDPELNEWSGTHRFTDEEGRELYTYTRPYADFASHEIPAGEVILIGILQCDRTADGTNRYTLRLRDETDCWY